MVKFKLSSQYKPSGDQPQAIKKILQGFDKKLQQQVLLGVTGSGKTFSVANVIASLNRPTLVIAHNKTLAAQLASEYRSFFPKNAVEYFVSYYDYYQPEAYIPASDTYIEKEAQINDEIDRLRHQATQALLTRRDVIIVASVSCIYGIGSPRAYEDASLFLRTGDHFDREAIKLKLTTMQYLRNEFELKRGTFRIKGNFLEIMPAHSEKIYRIDFTDDLVNSIILYNPLNMAEKESLEQVILYSAKHYVISAPDQQRAIGEIRKEAAAQYAHFLKNKKILEAERIKRKVAYDLELIEEVGYCNGIENYSLHLDGRTRGQAPDTLLSYFPSDFVTIIDESHVTIPQIAGMFAGDRARKDTLIEHGFRLPSARDNRPLNFEEFCAKTRQVLYTSATPADYELNLAEQVVEQIIRPTGLVDPVVEVRSPSNQIEDLIASVRKVSAKGQRCLITTLTKKMAEDFSDYLQNKGIKVKYLHSSVETLDRIKILEQLRRGEFDVLVGVNLLREGLDLPEVSFVAILDADQQGFLRSEKALIQTIGRAARNIDGLVVLYAQSVSPAMQKAIQETNRRRVIQLRYNKEHNITPKSIAKKIGSITDDIQLAKPTVDILDEPFINETIEQKIDRKQKEMQNAAKSLQFELAAVLRDELKQLTKAVRSIEKFSVENRPDQKQNQD